MSTYNSRVHFDGSTELTVETGGEIVVESGGVLDVESGGDVEVESGATITLAGSINVSGGMDIESGADVDIESGGHLDVESGGYIGIASGGWLAIPVIGATSSYAAGGSSNLAAIPANAFLYCLINGTSSRRHLDIAAPKAGSRLTIYVTPDQASSSGGIVFHSSDATFDSTNTMAMWVSSGSTYVTAGVTAGVLQLEGHSTSFWAVIDANPSTGWKFGTAT